MLRVHNTLLSSGQKSGIQNPTNKKLYFSFKEAFLMEGVFLLSLFLVGHKARIIKRKSTIAKLTWPMCWGGGACCLHYNIEPIDMVLEH